MSQGGVNQGGEYRYRWGARTYGIEWYRHADGKSGVLSPADERAFNEALADARSAHDRNIRADDMLDRITQDK